MKLDIQTLSSRTVVINVALATISFMTAYKLFLKKDKLISGSVNFTAAVFLVYGCFSTFYRLKRSGSPLSLIMLDVDHFKEFNDSYGHLAGDNCLRQIGTTLKTIVGRVPDIAARYGGEEFVVM